MSVRQLWGRCASCLFGIQFQSDRCPSCGSRRIVEFEHGARTTVEGIPPQPDIAPEDGWVRLSIKLYPDEAAAIEELARVKRCSKAYAFRRAVRAYFWGRTNWDDDEY